MNWGKASNILIMCLLILNASLFYMINQNNAKYQMSSRQEAAIIRLLSKNKINISYTKIPNSFEPMREIEMETAPYDFEAVKKAFLGSDPEIKRTVEFNKTKYTRQNQTLVISNDVIEYYGNDGDEVEVSVEWARGVASTYVTSLKNIFPNLVFDYAKKIDDSVIVSFYGEYKNNTVYSNYMKLTVNQKEGVKIKCSYGTPKGFYGEKNQICSPDEALLTFMHDISRVNIDEDTLFVDKMDLVYYREEAARATPFYRIYVKNVDTPFLVDAYTNLSLF